MDTTAANKQVFEIINSQAQRTEKMAKDFLAQRGVRDTGRLARSIQLQVLKATMQEVALEASFVFYGRFVDMGAGRGYTNGVRNKGYTPGARKTVARQKHPFYNKIIYGIIPRLVEEFAGTYLEQSQVKIKESLIKR